MYVKDVLYRSSIALQDMNPAQFTRWTQQEMIAYLNDGIKAIAKYMPTIFARIDAILLKAGTHQNILNIPSSNIIPGDGNSTLVANGMITIRIDMVIRNMGSNGATPGNACRVVERTLMDRVYPQWHTDTPAAYCDQYMFDPRYPQDFYCYPPITNATPVWAEIAYIFEPPTIPYGSQYSYSGTDTTKTNVPDRLTDDLVHYVIARASFKDSNDPSMITIFQASSQAFLSSINAQVEALTGHNPNLQVLPFLQTETKPTP